MTRPDFQQTVDAFMTSYNLEPSLGTRVYDLVAEVGELSKELLLGNQYGQREFRTSTEWSKELGDVFYSLITIANCTNVDLERALTTSLQKYIERIESKGTPDSKE